MRRTAATSSRSSKPWAAWLPAPALAKPGVTVAELQDDTGKGRAAGRDLSAAEQAAINKHLDRFDELEREIHAVDRDILEAEAVDGAVWSDPHQRAATGTGTRREHQHAEVEQRLVQLAPGLRIEPRRRLVENDQLRIVDQRLHGLVLVETDSQVKFAIAKAEVREPAGGGRGRQGRRIGTEVGTERATAVAEVAGLVVLEGLIIFALVLTGLTVEGGGGGVPAALPCCESAWRKASPAGAPARGPPASGRAPSAVS